MELKIEDIESRLYWLAWYRNYGVFTIIRKEKGGFEPDLQTPFFTGSEALETYRELKRAWRKNRAIFNSLCSEYSYS